MKVTQKQVNISRFNHLLAFGGLNWVVDRGAAKLPCSRLPRKFGNREVLSNGGCIVLPYSLFLHQKEVQRSTRPYRGQDVCIQV